MACGKRPEHPELGSHTAARPPPPNKQNSGYSRARADQRQSRSVIGFLTAAAPDRRLGV